MFSENRNQLMFLESVFESIIEHYDSELSKDPLKPAASKKTLNKMIDPQNETGKKETQVHYCSL